MDFIIFLRLAYLGAASVVLLAYFIPTLRDRFLAYGPRTASSSSTSAEPEKAARERPDTAPYTVLLDRLADVKVPHSWFTSFYQVSVVSSLFWATQILTKAPAFRAVAASTAHQDATMTFRQVLVAWLLLLVQGSRRLYECYALQKPSKSQMWAGHWVLGIGFYIADGLAVWVEGIRAIEQRTFSFADLTISAPDVRTFVSIILFILASGFQHDCHAYLASLKSNDKTDYKLPEHPAFARLVTPHYTAECVIYVALAMFAAPQGAWMNWTLVCALVFVIVNLGITANGTKAWYESKFGKQAVEGKWRMIPFLY